MRRISRDQKIRLMVAIVILWIAFATRLNRTSILGAQSDEGVHMVVANQVTKGEVIYADLFENRTPLVEWSLAGIFSLSGTFLLMGRLLTVAVSTITVAGLVTAIRSSRRIIGSDISQHGLAKWGDFIGAGLFAVSPLAIFWSRFTMLEPWQTAVSVLAINNLLFAVRKEKRALFLGAGLWSGIAVLTKQTGLILVASVFFYLGLLALKQQLKNSRRAIFYYLSGVIAPLLIFVLLLLFQDAFQPFLKYLSSIERLAPLDEVVDKLVSFIGWSIRQPAIPLAIGAGIIIIFCGPLKAWIIPIWALAETLALFTPPELDLGWGGFSHYALPMIAAISLLAGSFFIQIGRLKNSLIRQLAIAGVLFATGLTLVVTSRDINFVLRQSEYPQPDQHDEQYISEVIQQVTNPDQQVLIFANSIFYLLSDRPLPDVLFQLPEFLPEAPLWSELEPEVIRYLDEQVPGSVLVSRLHLERRFTAQLDQVLWRRWIPVDLLRYPYQNDVVLFLPLGQPNALEPRALAEFEPGIDIRDISIEQLGAKDLLVKITWSAGQKISNEPSVFLHMVSPDGELISQKDGTPVVGFRPFSTWAPNEIVQDWRLIVVPDDFDSEEYEIRVGLYDPVSGERYHLLFPDSAADYFSVRGRFN